ncbi:MAG: aminotransferase class V-fold PLP-dependent enzyme [Bacteroidota bacterium]
MNWQEVKSNYPAACDHVYLNTAACGLISSNTKNAVNSHFQYYLELGSNARDKWISQVEDTRSKAALLAGVAKENLLFVANYTAAMNQIAAMWQHRYKKVLMLEGDFPSVVLPWKIHKYTCHFFKASEGEKISLKTIESYLHKVKPDILAISHVQYNTGFRIDLSELAALCKKYGTIFLVDATQSYGAFPIEAKKNDVDVLISSVYKWTTAGFGLGICYINPELMENCYPNIAGNSSNGQELFPKIDSEVALKQAAFEIGHTNFPGIVSLNTALTDLFSIGIENIASRIVTLNQFLTSQLKEINETYLVTDFSEMNASGIISLKLPINLEKRLFDLKVITSYRNKGLRVSFHLYNDEKDLTTFTHLLQELSA